MGGARRSARARTLLAYILLSYLLRTCFKISFLLQVVMGVLNVANVVIFHVNVPKVEDPEGHVVVAGGVGDEEDHDEAVDRVFLRICGETNTQ